MRARTILLDDSVSSGTSMEEATERLEQAGLRVEGGICLVRFGWYGGYALMQERGYHMETVYDIWDDFISQMEDEDKADRQSIKMVTGVYLGHPSGPRRPSPSAPRAVSSFGILIVRPTVAPSKHVGY